MFVSEQVKNAERVQLDQIPLPDVPVDNTSKFSVASGHCSGLGERVLLRSILISGALECE